MLSYELREIFKKIYFANVCEDLPLRITTFTGFSFRKVLDFYFKRNRKLFYYEGTSLLIPLKAPERVKRVIF